MTREFSISNIDITILEKDIQEVQELLRIELVSNSCFESVWDILIRWGLIPRSSAACTN